MPGTGVEISVTDTPAELDGVPWPELHHAHGPATDVPGHLRALGSLEPGARDWAAFALLDTIYHRGTRWQASRHAVPFLVALIDDPATPDRPQVARLLRAVALGDRTEKDLPFSPVLAFADAEPVSEAEVARMIAARDPDDTGWDALFARWDEDAYLAAERHTARFARWLADPDTELAARAAELLAWFPVTPKSLVALIAMPPDPDRWLPRAGANLALAHLGTEAPGMTESLRAQLHATPAAVRLTAAIALAYRLGTSIPAAALDVLVSVPAKEDLPAVTPWHRTLEAFTAEALKRCGLS